MLNKKTMSIVKLNHIFKEVKKTILDIMYLLEKEKVDIHNPKLMQRESELSDEMEELTGKFKQYKNLTGATVVKNKYRDSWDNVDHLLQYRDEYIGGEKTKDDRFVLGDIKRYKEDYIG